jgi:hypothetical protein
MHSNPGPTSNVTDASESQESKQPLLSTLTEAGIMTAIKPLKKNAFRSICRKPENFSIVIYFSDWHL